MPCKGKWIPFEKAREYARGLGLKNKREWYQHGKSGQIPKNIPTAPYIAYKDEWKGMADWLGTNNKQHNEGTWIPFEDARAHAHSLKLKNTHEWWAYCASDQKPKNIPGRPDKAYPDEWKGFGDWLGTGNKCGRRAN